MTTLSAGVVLFQSNVHLYRLTWVVQESGHKVWFVVVVIVILFVLPAACQTGVCCDTELLLVQVMRTIKVWMRMFGCCLTCRSTLTMTTSGLRRS